MLLLYDVNFVNMAKIGNRDSRVHFLAKTNMHRYVTRAKLTLTNQKECCILVEVYVFVVVVFGAVLF